MLLQSYFIFREIQEKDFGKYSRIEVSGKEDHERTWLEFPELIKKLGSKRVRIIWN